MAWTWMRDSMRRWDCHTTRDRSRYTAAAAAPRTTATQQITPSIGRGGPASTSGREHFGLTPARAVHPTERGGRCDAAAVHQGGLGRSDVLGGTPGPPPLTSRRIMNRRIKSCDRAEQLASLVLEEVANFDQQNNTHALSRLAKLFRGSRQLLSLSEMVGNELPSAQVPPALLPAIQALTKRMYHLISSYDSWDATSSLWAYAQLGYVDEAAMDTLCNMALAMVHTFKPADCANVVVAFARMDYIHTELLRQLVPAVLDVIGECRPGEICQLLWAFARLGCHPGDLFLTEMVDAVHWHLDEYGNQELALVLWSLARLRHLPPLPFLAAAETHLLIRLPLLTPSDVCVSVWALPRLRYKAVRLLDELPAALLPRLPTLPNRELCGLVSAFATARHHHRVLLEAVAAEVLPRLPSLKPQELCIVLWTYGAFHHRPEHPDFARQLAGVLYDRMPQLSPQGLAMTAKALAQLRWRSGPLLAQLAGAAERQLAGFKPLEMSQLLWGLSQLHCPEEAIFHAVVRRCIAILQDQQHPHYGHMRHRVVNSIIASCQRRGFIPWLLLDFAESKGIRVKQPCGPDARPLGGGGCSGVGSSISG
ncbi:hypothetical protein Agub_g12362, partial [Astrephomene gubernaculifera]